MQVLRHYTLVFTLSIFTAMQRTYCGSELLHLMELYQSRRDVMWNVNVRGSRETKKEKSSRHIIILRKSSQCNERSLIIHSTVHEIIRFMPSLLLTHFSFTYSYTRHTRALHCTCYQNFQVTVLLVIKE